MDVSVVLTAYNRVGVLPRAIASVLAQQDASFELIVIDDASTDTTPAYLATLSDPRVVTRRAPRNLGPSAARNLGLDLARADIVAFLDSDDACLPRRLAAPLAAFRTDANLVCTLSSARKHDREVTRDARIPDMTLPPAAFEWALLCDLIPVEASSITVRRSAVLRAGGFSPVLRLTEDREFLIRLARQGAGQTLSEILWEKFWSEDGLSNARARAAPGLIAYAQALPQLTAQFPKLASYLATKVLAGHLRDRQYALFRRDYALLRSSGLIGANPLRLVSDHREVSRYRRTMSRADELRKLERGPESWR